MNEVEVKTYGLNSRFMIDELRTFLSIDRDEILSGVTKGRPSLSVIKGLSGKLGRAKKTKKITLTEEEHAYLRKELLFMSDTYTYRRELTSFRLTLAQLGLCEEVPEEMFEDKTFRHQFRTKGFKCAGKYYLKV